MGALFATQAVQPAVLIPHLSRIPWTFERFCPKSASENSSQRINGVAPQDRQTITLRASNEAQTARIATALAAHLQAGDVVLLDGSLAAGKTFFIRALVGALGSDEDVTSPTYTIANVYETPVAPVLHVDAYRLETAKEFYHLGLDDYFETGICLIEWGQRIDGFFDTPLQIDIGFGDTDEMRVFQLSSTDKRWARVFETLVSDAHD
ncbi:MAG: tRNA threonylcarbamoyladenosine biosynthesis protein TsaE [Celeribacter sp.]|jgi:tRNA threonylcarbamoyladenosine biosynthesis protein TsaE